MLLAAQARILAEDTSQINMRIEDQKQQLQEMTADLESQTNLYTTTEADTRTLQVTRVLCRPMSVLNVNVLLMLGRNQRSAVPEAGAPGANQLSNQVLQTAEGGCCGWCGYDAVLAGGTKIA
jgi:hypothetical protein